jgi:hypothetical protein
MDIFWLAVVVVGCLFIPSPVSAWGRAQIKKLWNLVFKKKTDVAV